jgi:hypothetical protein
VDLLPSEPLSKNSESSTDLLLGAPDSDMVLPKQGATVVLDGEGSNMCTRYVCDLFKATSLSSNDMTCTGIRNDTGHGETLRGRRSLREVLSEWECEGDSAR